MFSRETVSTRKPAFWVDPFQPDKDRDGVVSTSLMLAARGYPVKPFVVDDDLKRMEGFVLRKRLSEDTQHAGYKDEAIVGYVLVERENKSRVFVALPSDYDSPTLRNYCMSKLGIPTPTKLRSPVQHSFAPASGKSSASERNESYVDAEMTVIEDIHQEDNLTEITIFMDGKAKVRVTAPVESGKRRVTVTGLPAELEPSSVSIYGDNDIRGFMIQETEFQARAATSLGFNSDLVGRRVKVHWTETVDSEGGNQQGNVGPIARVNEDEGRVMSLILPPSALSEKYGLVLRSDSEISKYPLKAIYGHISKIEVEAKECEQALMATKEPGCVVYLTLENLTEDSLSLDYICSGLSWTPIYYLHQHYDGGNVVVELVMRARVTNFSKTNFRSVQLTLVDGYLRPFHQRIQNVPYNDLGVRGLQAESLPTEEQQLAEDALQSQSAPSQSPTPLQSFSIFEVNHEGGYPFHICEDYPGRESSRFYKVFSHKIRDVDYYLIYGARGVPGSLPDQTSAVLQFRNTTTHALPKGGVYIKNYIGPGMEYVTELTKPVPKNGLVSLNAGENRLVSVYRHPKQKSASELEGGGKRHTIKQDITFSTAEETTFEITVILKLKAKEQLMKTSFKAHGEDREVPFRRWQYTDEEDEPKNRPNPFTGEAISEADYSWYYFVVPLEQEVTATYELEYFSN